jgi:hypothetical protein
VAVDEKLDCGAHVEDFATSEEDKRLLTLALSGISVAAMATQMKSQHVSGPQPHCPVEDCGGQIEAEGEAEMTGTPRAPWTQEQDKELRALVLSANSIDTIAKTLNRTTFAVRRRANTLRLPLRKIARLRRLI